MTTGDSIPDSTIESLLPQHSGRSRILVIEDDWLNRDLLGMYLQDAGYDCTLVEDGVKGLESVAAHPPDLVVCDVQMPHMSGYEVCRRLKANPATRFVPVVMVTALDSDEEKLQAVEAGADDFIIKPFNSIMLLTRVRSLLRIKQLHDDVEARNGLLRQILDRYMAEDIVSTILTDPERHLKLGGEMRSIAVLFADIRGFTGFTERVGAAQVVTTLNRIFPQMTNLIFKYRGTFDKYLGDAIMAFWGAPVTTGDDVYHAICAAVEMRDTFNQMRIDTLDIMGSLGLGLGIHFGEATVGNIGSERVMDYTAIGDTVNVAARLQQLAKSSEILITESAYLEVKGRITVTRLNRRKLSGRRDSVTVYSVQNVVE